MPRAVRCIFSCRTTSPFHGAIRHIGGGPRIWCRRCDCRLQCTGGIGGTAGYSAPFGAAPALCAGQSGADAGGVSGGADVSLDGSSNISLLFWKFLSSTFHIRVFVSVG